MIRSILSGGQTGVDRAALDSAMAAGIVAGGWCPRGRMAEDGKIPEIYPMTETKEEEPSERTRLNVLHSDGTLILLDSGPDSGTEWTERCCLEASRPCLKVMLNDPGAINPVIKWLEENFIEVLNVAGPRESHSPGIYSGSRKFLDSLFNHLIIRNRTDGIS